MKTSAYAAALAQTPFFTNISESDARLLMDCLNTRIKRYDKGEMVLAAGKSVTAICLLVAGRLHIQSTDYWGNRALIHEVERGQLFAHAYVGGDGGPIPNEIVAAEDAVVAFFDAAKVLHPCSRACGFHLQLITNLFSEVSRANRALTRKMALLARRSTREMIKAYFSEEAAKARSPEIEIPFNRQELADFLLVDRAALSRELCKMRDEGMISFEKNKFTLHRPLPGTRPSFRSMSSKAFSIRST